MNQFWLYVCQINNQTVYSVTMNGYMYYAHAIGHAFRNWHDFHPSPRHQTYHHDNLHTICFFSILNDVQVHILSYSYQIQYHGFLQRELGSANSPLSFWFSALFSKLLPFWGSSTIWNIVCGGMQVSSNGSYSFRLYSGDVESSRAWHQQQDCN